MKTGQYGESTKAKILIVEDDTPLAMMMVNVLTQASCEVQVAKTGKGGMALALENRFDLFVLAVDSPDTNGFEICHQLKQRHIARHTPVIFISARHGEKERQHGLECGAVDYITKPLDPRDFVSRVLAHVQTGKLGSAELFSKVT